MKEVLVLFTSPQGNKKQYDNVWKDLKATGHASPKGLVYHVAAARPEGGFMVVDVWESEEAFKEFSKVIKPILEKNDILSSLPEVQPIYNIYEKHKAASASL